MADTTSSLRSTVNTSASQTNASARADLEEQRKQADSRVRPDVESERNKVQQEAEETLDSEAVVAIQQTERAVNAIAEGRVDEALKAIEQATGKINILLGRNPKTALIAVNFEVSIIDRAPRDFSEIALLKDAAEIALDLNDLPSARTLLDSLRSEIRVRLYQLPLATYPDALAEAARLLDQKKNSDAASVLLVALNTLAVTDQVTSIPLLLARKAVSSAQSLAEKDKDSAEQMLDVARNELERAMELGYTSNDSEYKDLLAQIRNLRKQLKGPEDTSSPFSKLKEKLAALTRRGAEKKVGSDTQNRPKHAA